MKKRILLLTSPDEQVVFVDEQNNDHIYAMKHTAFSSIIKVPSLMVFKIFDQVQNWLHVTSISDP